MDRLRGDLLALDRRPAQADEAFGLAMSMAVAAAHGAAHSRPAVVAASTSRAVPLT